GPYGCQANLVFQNVLYFTKLCPYTSVPRIRGPLPRCLGPLSRRASGKAGHGGPRKARRRIHAEPNHVVQCRDHRPRERVDGDPCDVATEQLGRSVVQKRARARPIAITQMMESHRDLDQPLQGLALAARRTQPVRLKQFMDFEVEAPVEQERGLPEGRLERRVGQIQRASFEESTRSLCPL